MKSLANVQQLGRALMLPIAVLPVAGILLRLGQPDVAGLVPALHLEFLAAAGGAMFTNLGLLFAIGVAVGFARENHGAAGLAGVVCYLIATVGAGALIHTPPEVIAGYADKAKGLADQHYRDDAIQKFKVPIGILSGVIAGQFYNRFYNIKLPEYLAFFGGRRFVPIISGLAGAGLALVFGFGFPWLKSGLEAVTHAILASGDVGLFLYGMLNRLLIVTGLHHILNNIPWFILGEYHGATGDLNRFFAGDKTAGVFMAGYFPVMMFGLPAACFAMYRAALPGRRKAVGGMLLSVSLTSILTGVTEPIEFSFMFLAPGLFALHAVLTGLSFVIMNALGVKLGFSFSAGLFDLLINWKLETRQWLLFVVGPIYALVYYGVFRTAIAVFKLQTPGREPDDSIEADTAAPIPPGAPGDRIDGLIAALGGASNLVTVDACTTRLRLVVRDSSVADVAGLKRLGARGVVRPSPDALQVVLGPEADQVAGEMRARLSAPRAQPSAAPAAAPAKAMSPEAPPVSPAAVIKALGGAGNIAEVTPCASRLRARVRDAAAVDAAGLKALGLRAVARPKPDSIHLIVGSGADALAGAVLALL